MLFRIGNNIRKEIVVNCRKLSTDLRPLPDFIIIGAQKGGTTSLFSYLALHPQILPGIKKEINFFTLKYHKGLPWYKAHFPLKKSSEEITGEASPHYIFDEYAPERMSQIVPQCKVIALLRNPVERAISHYFHAVRVNMENLPLREALLIEEERMLDIAKNPARKTVSYSHASYKKKGIYSEQIKHYLRYFPMAQILIIESERFFNNPDEVLKEVFRFLSVDESFQAKNLKPLNIGKNRKRVDSEIYEYLTEYFVPHNRELYRLIGQTFDW